MPTLMHTSQPFDALLIDLDECLLRVPDLSLYGHAMYKALLQVLAAHGRTTDMTVEDYSRRHESGHGQGKCMQTALGEEFGLSRVELHRVFHECIDRDGFVYDTDSGMLLNRLQVPALFYTDGERTYATETVRQLGCNLPIWALSDMPDDFHRKGSGTLNWPIVHSKLEELAGRKLERHRIGLLDDSATNLRQALRHGFGAVQIHFAFPGRQGTEEFKYHGETVGHFLVQHGFVTMPLQPAPRRTAQSVNQLG